MELQEKISFNALQSYTIANNALATLDSEPDSSWAEWATRHDSYWSLLKAEIRHFREIGGNKKVLHALYKETRKVNEGSSYQKRNEEIL